MNHLLNKKNLDFHIDTVLQPFFQRIHVISNFLESKKNAEILFIYISD